MCKGFNGFLFLSLSFLLVVPASAQTVTLPIIEKNLPKEATTNKEDFYKAFHQAQAVMLLQQGKTDEASKEAELALANARKKGDKEVIASCNSVLGKVYRAQQRYDESLKAYQEAYDYWKTQPGPGFMLAMILNNMGEEYRAMDKLDKARATLLDAQSKGDETMPNYCAIVENLGIVNFKLAKFADAEKSWKKAVETAEKGGDWRSAVDSMCSLTYLYKQLGRYVEMNEMAEKAIAKTEMYFGPGDSRIADIKRIQASAPSPKS